MFGPDPIRTLREAAAAQGGVACLQEGLWLVSAPALVHRALQSPALVKRQGKERATCLLGRGLMTSEGELNRLQRRRLRPLFRASERAHWDPIIREEAADLASQWNEGQKLNTLAELSRLSLAVACRCLLGRRLPEEPVVLEALEESLQRADSIPALQAVRDRLDGVAARVLAHEDGPLPVLLRRLPIDDELRRDELITMLLGAHETTAATMAWCLRLLAVYGQPPSREAVAETLRLYPPGWIIGRTLEAPLELGGRLLEPPATLLFSPMVTHYLPEVWPEPQLFRPERFVKKPGKGAYFPFGGGDRVCIGEQLAWAEAEAAVEEIASRWRLEPLDRGPVTLRPLAALRPACGLPARVTQY